MVELKVNAALQKTKNVLIDAFLEVRLNLSPKQKEQKQLKRKSEKAQKEKL